MFLLLSVSPGLALGQFDILIDREVEKQHGNVGKAFAPRCSDEAFVRRIYLDLAGRNPTADEARDFLDHDASDKRDSLISELINRPSFGVQLADRWDVELTHANLQWPLMPFTHWLQRQFNQDRPWDEMAYELLTANGPQFSNPAVTMFFGPGHNSTLTPEQATDLVGRAFMGITLECAQCHDHPSSQWTHREYWGIAGFLGNTQLSSRWPNNKDAPSRKARETEGTNVGVIDSNSPSWRYEAPDRALKVAAAIPASMSGSAPNMAGRSVRSRTSQSRTQFADWLLASETPYLARSFVNREWHHLFGCGLVTPVDDHRENNPPLYPDLQMKIATAFRDQGYPVKELYGGICRSVTYQQESVTHEDPRSLAGTNLRVLSPNQVFDSLHSILGDEAVTAKRGIYGKRGARRGFISGFGDESVIGTPTAFSKGMRDFLRMLNSQRLESGVKWRVEQHKDLWTNPQAMLDELFLLVLSRRPSDAEMERMSRFVAESDSAEQGYQGVLWALLNTGEFFLVP